MISGMDEGVAVLSGEIMCCPLDAEDDSSMCCLRKSHAMRAKTVSAMTSQNWRQTKQSDLEQETRCSRSVYGMSSGCGNNTVPQLSSLGEQLEVD